MDIRDRKYNMLLQVTDLSNAVGRDQELMHITRVLLRDMKNNAIVIGNPGIGKKALIEGLAAQMAKNKAFFIDAMIYLDAQTILFNYLTRREVFIIELKEQIESCKNTVFFLPDIHAMFQEDKDEVKRLYPLFSVFANRLDLRLIATIDPSSYRGNIEKDIFLHNLFEPIRLEEASEESSKQIIKAIADKKRIEIDTETIEHIVTLSKRYIFSKFLPGKALDIFDESYAKAKYELRSNVTDEDVKEVISAKTGIPITSITASDQEKLLHLETHLTHKVVGQSNAVRAVSEVIRRSRIGLKDPRKPIGSFLFVGGSGVGKTELAKSLAEFMYDSESSLIRLDMSEYTESHSLQRLIGAPPGYVGYEEGGQLTNPIWERPYSLLLLDEIEKAHPKVFDVFLQVLDEGRLTDGQGKTVNFNNSIIIATSNAGYTEIIDDILEGIDIWDRKFIDQRLVPILMKYFRLEFLNRFDEIIVFKPLGEKDLIAVTKIQIQQLRDRLKEKHITLRVSDELIKQIAVVGKNPLFGARAIKRVIQQKIENTIAQKILQGEIKEGSVISW